MIATENTTTRVATRTPESGPVLLEYIKKLSSINESDTSKIIFSRSTVLAEPLINVTKAMLLLCLYLAFTVIY